MTQEILLSTLTAWQEMWLLFNVQRYAEVSSGYKPKSDSRVWRYSILCKKTRYGRLRCILTTKRFIDVNAGI